MSDQSEIVNFFKNQTIFLTGGTGFVGKILLEKLLRTCWDVKKIYVLIRRKKTQSPQQRFDELFNLPCFKLIQHKNLKEKVFLVNGDCKEFQLGLNDEDITILKQETNIILHAAANVKLDQSFKDISQGIKATQDLITLAKDMSSLKVFIYISTAYSNCLNLHIKEEIYKPPLNAETFINLVDSIDNELLEKLTPVLLDKWPTTYIYGKCITEDLIKRAGLGVPTAIVRPGMIINSIAEPLPGWIDNFYGLVGILIGGGLGILRTMHSNIDCVVSVVPVDHVSNNIMAVAWCTDQKKPKTVKVYNCVGFELDNAITVRNVLNESRNFYYDIPCDQAIWYPIQCDTRHRWLYKIIAFWLHTVPAYLIDFVLFVTGHKTIAVKGYQKAHKFLDLGSYFSTREWTFEQENMKELWSLMNEHDKKTFNFSLKEFNFKNYLYDMLVGIRTYLLKYPEETIPKARRRLKILTVLHYAFLAVIYYLFYKLIAFLFKIFFLNSL